ncbi:MAG: hypothetical protein LUF04_09805 [Bacteroides sp.]|nr:hypothetical protein [Bacteroides sp.]
MPPFTDHADAPERDEHGHGSHPEIPAEDAAGFNIPGENERGQGDNEM